ncbi:MAG: urease accessory UreF family protein [Pseudomonadota bacterium]
MIAEGTVHNAQTLQRWLTDVIAEGSGRSDCILLRAAYHAPDPASLAEIDATARAFAPSAERLQETVLQGAAFGATTQAIWDHPPQELTYPVALGAAARQAELDVDLTAAMYLQAFTSNLVSAATRALPLGQTEGQRVLAALTPLCTRIATETATSTLDNLASCAWRADIASMQHETLQPRIFKS